MGLISYFLSIQKEHHPHITPVGSGLSTGQPDLTRIGFLPPPLGFRIVRHGPHISLQIRTDILEVTEQVFLPLDFGHIDRIVPDIFFRPARSITERESMVHSSRFRIIRHGFPAANTSAGISRVTTLPAPITDRGPTRMPGLIIAPLPIQTSEPISTGRANSGPLRRSAALMG